VCGWRQFLLEHAYLDHGHNNWFLVLHGDEIWTRNPRSAVSDRYDGYIYRLPFFFPREGEEWDPDVHPVDQLHWSLWPGFPEFRLFRGGQHVHYDRGQRFNTRPQGIQNVAICHDPILHYLYRSPEVQRSRAAVHQETQFDPDNYQHITDRDDVYWTDDMIAGAMGQWYDEVRDMAMVAA
jgi:hypothetical protein